MILGKLNLGRSCSRSNRLLKELNATKSLEFCLSPCSHPNPKLLCESLANFQTQNKSNSMTQHKIHLPSLCKKFLSPTSVIVFHQFNFCHCISGKPNSWGRHSQVNIFWLKMGCWWFFISLLWITLVLYTAPLWGNIIQSLTAAKGRGAGGLWG